MRIWLRFSAVLLCFVLSAGPGAKAVMAQQQIPSSADAGRSLPSYDDQANRYDLEQSSELKSKPPILSPDVANRSFVLDSLTVNGVSAFSDSQIKSYYQPYLGQSITVAQLFGILNALQQLYLDEGYTLSKVIMPDQSIEDGAIIFTVIEGYIAHIDVDPSLPDVTMIEDFTRSVLAMRPVNLRKLERMLLILNDRPGLRVTTILANSAEQGDADAVPGAINLFLQNTHAEKSLSAYASLDNFGSAYTGAGQVSGGLSVNNLGLNFADIFLNAKVAIPPSELCQVGAEYTQPLLGVSGLNFIFSANVTRTEPGAELEKLDVAGRSLYLRASLQYPLIRQREKNLTVSADFNYKNVETDVLHSRIFDDHIRTVGLQADYSFLDAFGGSNNATLSFTQGLSVFNGSTPSSANLSRQDGRGKFQRMKAKLSHLHPLWGTVDLLGSVRGQYSWQPLLSSEEFGFGGSEIGRGYDPSEITGDRGVSASLELRYGKSLPEYNLGLQPFLFYDVGKVWNIDRGAKNKISAASAGAGLRVNWNNDWSFSAIAAKPLTLSPAKPPKYATETSPRFLLGVTKNF